MWWAVVDEYVESGVAENFEDVGAKIEALAATEEDDEVLLNALVEVGCFYWPRAGESQRDWLRDVASRLRESGSVPKGDGRRCLPTGREGSGGESK